MFGKRLKYVLTDCDGTISNHDFTINEDTRKDILKYQKKSGYRFSFITGRLDISSKKIADELKVQLPIVSCNGALITDINTGEVLHADYINKETCIDIFRKAAIANLDIMVYEPGAMVGTPNSTRLNTWKQYNAKVEKKYQFKTVTYDDLDQLVDAIGQGIVKPVELIFYADNQKDKEAGYKIFAEHDEVIDYVQSLPVMFNVMSKGVNKLSGLKHFADIVGIDYRRIAAFGDNHNDIEMISGVDQGYAVGNAVDELKSVAYKTIDSIDNNGVGKQLIEFMEDNRDE